MREIPLSKGMTALVDDEDYERLSLYKWSYHPLGYAVRQVTKDGKSTLQYMHREIIQAPLDREVDHLNGDGLDNRRQNLRLVEHALNCRNQQTRPHSSRFKGVSFDKKSGRYHAQIMINYRTIHLGSFLDEKQAALAYDAASREYHGAYGRPNFARAAGSRSSNPVRPRQQPKGRGSARPAGQVAG